MRRHPKPYIILASVLLIIGLLLPAEAPAASADNNVEWAGISHYEWMDKRPLCPLEGEPFQVRFQAYREDLTSARVRMYAGTETWVNASPIDTRGPYQIWAADLPGTAANTLSYYIEVTDGTDTDYYSRHGMSEDPPAGGEFTVNYVTLDHAPTGVTPTATGTVFKVWAPDALVANVRGEFNGWGLTNPMVRIGEHMIANVLGAAPRQEFKFYFNNSSWKPAARGRGLDSGEYYNTYIEDPLDYVWVVDDFQVPPFEEMVIYQVHVGTFAGRNDPNGSTPFPSRYEDVAARASHLAELGINVVMLCPITEFPGDLSAGYNPITSWAPESIYGDPDDLKAMVDALHAEGIAVILDIVWNHFSDTDNYLWYYDGSQHYFDDPVVNTPWGSQADFDNPYVRDYFVHSAHLWLEEYRMDGFRMDATDYMNIPPQEAAGWGLMQRLNDEVDNRSADKIVIAEQLPDDPWVTRPTSLGGAGFDAQYYDNFTDRLREEIFDAAFGDPEMYKIRNIINGSGEYLSGRYVVNYLELHDEAWPTSGGQRIVKTIDTTFPHDDIYAKGRTKLGQGLVLTAPGIPAMLQGDEWLEDTDFGTDPQNRIDWSKKTTYANIFQYYQDLIALRTGNPALRANAGWEVYHLNESGNVLAFQRFDLDGNVVVVVVNFGNNNYSGYRIGLPQPGDWIEAINSQDSAYDGNGQTNPGTLTAEGIAADGKPQSVALNVPQMALIVLQWGTGASDVPENGPEQSSATFLLLQGISPNPSIDGARVVFRLTEASEVTVEVFDAAGRSVAQPAAGNLEVGEHSILWDGRDASGQPAAAGVYNIRVSAGGRTAQGKMTILR